MALIEPSMQPVAAMGIGIYVMAVLFATKTPYDLMVSRGVEHIRAVYYNRKIVHMLAGGVGALSGPILFSSLWYPAGCGAPPMLFTGVG